MSPHAGLESAELWQDGRGFRVSMRSGQVVAVELLKGKPAKAAPGSRSSPALRAALALVKGQLLGRPAKAGALLRLQGTDFQVKVWKALLKVPFGSTLSYGQLAARAGFPGAARAVGSAMAANPIPVLVPCHRVLAAKGIGGYSQGLEWKRWLLSMEGVSL